MVLGGIQKLTLLDYPGLVACTVFTVGCNMRCPFCHNAALVSHTDAQGGLDEEEFFAFLRKRRGILDGVCVSGGEPTLQPDIENFVAKIKGMGFKVKLDTNGSFPDVLRRLLESGNIDYVAMDLKNIPERYGMTVGIADFDVARVIESIGIIKESGVDYEFRTTVVSPLHRASDFEEIARLIQFAPRYYLQNFVDSGDLVSGGGLTELGEDELAKALENTRVIIPQAKIRGEE